MKLYQDRIWMREKYLNEQLTRRQIAEIAGCDVTTVRDWMKRFGIKPRESAEARWPGRKRAPYRDEAWLRQKYEVERLTVRQVARVAGCGDGTIADWMERFNIEGRRSGPQVSRGEPYKDAKWLNQRYWEEGLTLAQVAELVGCDATLIRDWMVKLGISRRPRGVMTEYAMRGEVPPWRDSEWLAGKYWGEGLSTIEIGQQVGVQYGIIAYWMDRLGVPRRDCIERSLGSRNPNWRGGGSFEPYPIEFNPPLKREIRLRDDYTCIICRMAEGKRAHDVHHIDYDKGHNERGNLITLCASCHRVTNGNRQYWQQVLGRSVGI